MRQENISHSTGTFNKTQISSDLQVAIIPVAAYVVVMVIALLGNSVVIHIVRTRQSLQNATNLLIMNQACADLLLCTIDTLEELIRTFSSDGWFEGILGSFSCKTFRLLIYSTTVCSVWSLGAISIDRFNKVVRPLQQSFVSEHLKKVIVLVWLWSLISPSLFVPLSRVVKLGEQVECIIDANIDSFPLWEIAALIMYSVNFALPLIIIMVFFSIICWRLCSRQVPGEGANQDRRQAEAMATAKKVTWMLIVIVALFVLGWLPYSTIVLLKGFHKLYTNTTRSVAIILSRLYSAVNPYVFLSFNDKCRGDLKSRIGRCFSRRVIPGRISVSRNQSWELQNQQNCQNSNMDRYLNVHSILRNCSK